MRYCTLIILALCCTIALNAQTKNQDKRFAGIDTAIERYLKDWHAAGCAVAVVQKNKVIFSSGFGYKDYSKRLPVTDNTLFAIGSCSKAFTSSLLGMLVKDGLLDLDKPVHQYLPELEFYNEHLTAHITSRDMMTHRTGLPRHDYSWYGATVSRDSLLRRIKYLEPNAELREKWQYNNFMFLAQGVLAEKLYGKRWEALVKEKIFAPLGMNNSNFSVNDLQKAVDYTLGYREQKDSVIRMEYMNIDPIGPAGSINSTVKDMANWLITWINGGKFNGKEVLPPSYVTQASSSQMVISGGFPAQENPDVYLSNYGFGWFISSYRGHYRVEHGGNIDGFSASTSFFPSDSLGIVVLVNQNSSALPAIIRNTITDRLMNLPYRDWNNMQKVALQKNKTAAKLKVNTDSTNRKSNTKPSHMLSAYTGTYNHPGYGAVNIRLNKDTLWVDYNFSNNKLFLSHYHYDVFSMRSTDDPEQDNETIKLNFGTNNKGEIETITIPLEPSIKDILFTRVPATIKLGKKELEKYTGDYVMGEVTIKFYLKGDSTLMGLVPGQPDYEMVPTRKDEFDLKIAKGFSVRFTYEGTEITGVTFIQPNGMFNAKKKK